MLGPISASMIDDVSSELGVSITFCYVLIGIMALTIVFAIVAWVAGGRRRKREKFEATKKVCPSCGGDNKPDDLLCKHCDEMI